MYIYCSGRKLLLDVQKVNAVERLKASKYYIEKITDCKELGMVEKPAVAGCSNTASWA